MRTNRRKILRVALLLLLGCLVLLGFDLSNSASVSFSKTSSTALSNTMKPSYLKPVVSGKPFIGSKTIQSGTSTTTTQVAGSSVTESPTTQGSPASTTTQVPSPSTSTTVSSPVVSHEPMKDLGIQPATLTQSQWDVLLNIAQSAGAKVISFDLNWASYEPNGPAPSGEWTNLDSFVSDVRSRGLLIRIQIVGMPDWARSPGEPSFASAPWLAPSTPGELQAWSQFVTRLASHFGNEVAYYEIWNEENESTFFSQGPNPSIYANILESSYVAIRSATSVPQVMFGGTSRNDIGFVSQVYYAIDAQFPATAISDHHFFDILGVHPYSGDRAPSAVLSSWVYQDQWGTMDENYTGFEELHALMAQQGEGYKHIYISEFGYNTVPWNGFSAVSDSTRATYLTEAFNLAAQSGYVDGLCWYYFYPTPWNPSSWTLLQGSGPSWQQTATFTALENVPNS